MSRELLKAHTVDIRRPNWGQHESALGRLVTTAHDSDASDDQAEAAALAFLDAWGRHVVFRKTARYGLILHTLRHRPELADKVAAFSEFVDQVGATSGGIEGWYTARHAGEVSGESL